MSGVHGRQARSGEASRLESSNEGGRAAYRIRRVQGEELRRLACSSVTLWRRCSAGAIAWLSSRARKGGSRSAWGNGGRGPRDPRHPVHDPLLSVLERDPVRWSEAPPGRRVAYRAPRVGAADQSREITGGAASPGRALQTGSRSSGPDQGGVSHEGRRGQLSCKAPRPLLLVHAPMSRRAPTLRGHHHASPTLPARWVAMTVGRHDGGEPHTVPAAV